MKPQINPFRLQRMAKIQPQNQPVQAPAAPAIKGMRGLTGEEKAQAMSTMSQDVSIRAARIQYLKTLGQKIYEELEQDEEIGTSRLAWLNKQLSQKDY